MLRRQRQRGSNPAGFYRHAELLSSFGLPSAGWAVDWIKYSFVLTADSGETEPVTQLSLISTGLLGRRTSAVETNDHSASQVAIWLHSPSLCLSCSTTLATEQRRGEPKKAYLSDSKTHDTPDDETLPVEEDMNNNKKHYYNSSPAFFVDFSES